MPADIDAGLASAREVVAGVIAGRPDFGPEPIDAAMRYALDGGKGMRAFLVIEGARLCGTGAGASGPAAAAIECIHAYSLVHDDLPCMDDDDLRRGRPTLHRKWDEATAVLAGDALQSLAFELVLDAGCDDATKVTLTRSLAEAARGMVGGQALDIAAEEAETPLTLDEIEALQALKTGKLIRWSATAGALIAGADAAPFDAYGQALGLAFQIADDVLDATGDAAEVGKAVGKDAAAGKATFVSLLGVDGARDRAQALADAAVAALDGYGPEADTLRDLARFTVTRRS
ncbi:polyprenyl synthetase family protein [Pelagovum pacificum]|uniref:Geranylgeranyl diphosphate synthase n=1 Tax=Pelagovum pacificum TaxID=2588711 RepID=A0A5C5GIY0_9RHOB|nr:polyprenyl synthetase family protein [Pelagovum pacificum]QQA43024.1 polyprenyl synthetase family protein [Pelagovum pacificum]TNY33831.1 polyprenyl synthetase family protein [Pelagovum pacificum]